MALNFILPAHMYADFNKKGHKNKHLKIQNDLDIKHKRYTEFHDLVHTTQFPVSVLVIGAVC